MGAGNHLFCRAAFASLPDAVQAGAAFAEADNDLDLLLLLPE